MTGWLTRSMVMVGLAVAALVSATLSPSVGVAATPGMVVVPAAAATSVQGWSTTLATVTSGGAIRRSVRVQSGGEFVLRVVRVETRKPGRTWATAGTGSTASDGRIDLVMRTPLVGSWQFRLVVPATAGYEAVTTAVLPVTVTPKPAEYVALGDSYASGEGLGPWTTNPNTDNRSKGTGGFNTCHRSANDAYAVKQTNSRFLVRPGVAAGQRSFWACSGATVASMNKLRADLAVDLPDFRNGEPNQLPVARIPGRTVGATTKWISMSVGGNDAGFDKVVKSCLHAYGSVLGHSRIIRVPGFEGCATQLATSTSGLAALKTRLQDAYARLLAAAPQAKLVVVGYPRVLPDSYSQGKQMTLTAQQRDAADVPPDATRICATNKYSVAGTFWWAGVVDKHATALNTFEKKLNDTIRQAVAATATTYRGRIEFADTWNTSVPHNCTGTTNGVSVNGVMLSGSFTGLPETLGAVSTATFHPTKIGQQRMGQAVEAAFIRLATTAGAITLVSTAADGTAGNHISQTQVFSPDGTRIAFTSAADNLVPGDTNNTEDVFVKTLATGEITRVSTAAGGTQAKYGQSTRQAFSPDGTRIAFTSRASNLVPGDTNDAEDVFVKTLATGAITRVSTTAGGTQANSNNHGSGIPVFSPDGTRIAFTSDAGNLVPGDTNNDDDVFVKTLATGEITRVSTAAGGTQANGRSYEPVFSPDGTRIAFISTADNLVSGDTTGDDVFVKTLATGEITRVSTTAGGTQANYGSWRPVFSPDGTRIAFYSRADNLVSGDTNDNDDVFVKTLATGEITRVSTAADGTQTSYHGGSLDPAFSPDGTRIAFTSDADNLVPGDTNNTYDVFVKTLASGAITLLPTTADGTQANGGSWWPVFSPDGTRIAFTSTADNLVPGTHSDHVFVETLPR